LYAAISKIMRRQIVLYYSAQFLGNVPSLALLDSLLYNFYSSPNIIRMMKWRKMRWPGHVAFIK
jgi:hypothetical protein